MTTLIHPFFAANAAVYAIQNATTEGKATVLVLLVLSLFSWSIIISKFRQLNTARKATVKFLAAYASTRDPLDIKRKGEIFRGAPAYKLYLRGAEELDYQLQHNPVTVKGERRISNSSFDAVKVVLEEAAGNEALALEKGMIVLSTAVAGGPFIGLLGTVWGVMSTFAGIAETRAATLTAMAPGVAAALVATVTGLLVAIPAMFAYNFMVTTIRHLTQELDSYATRYANQIEHTYVDNRDIEDKIAFALTRVEMGENTPAI
jgi:biopolymer transport protein ExbB/TolQ